MPLLRLSLRRSVMLSNGILIFLNLFKRNLLDLEYKKKTEPVFE